MRHRDHVMPGVPAERWLAAVFCASGAAALIFEVVWFHRAGLVFGHEKDGVGGNLASIVQTSVRIPMLGEKRSLNVATAAGVVLYELVRRWRDERRT